MQNTFETIAHPSLTWVLAALGASSAAASPAVAPPQRLRKGQTLVVEQPQGQAVLCTEGALWITHDGTPDDHIVDMGQRHTCTDKQRMLVHALSDARVQMFRV
jgi:hypothetical protein